MRWPWPESGHIAPTNGREEGHTRGRGTCPEGRFGAEGGHLPRCGTPRPAWNLRSASACAACGARACRTARSTRARPCGASARFGTALLCAARGKAGRRGTWQRTGGAPKCCVEPAPPRVALHGVDAVIGATARVARMRHLALPEQEHEGFPSELHVMTVAVTTLRRKAPMRWRAIPPPHGCLPAARADGWRHWRS